MTANLYSSKLSKSKFRNWLKAELGVLLTKEGITPFVCEEIEQFQQKCLSDICNNNGLPSGSTCSGCCTENVVICPTNRICNVGRGRCTFHRDSVTQYIPSGCPGKICHNIKKEIQEAHRYYGPSYRNTDATQWCSNPWEVAKCFMPPDGYKNVVSATEIDFNGINSVIINFKDIQSKVHADLSKTNNIFNQGRELGNAVRHSPYLEVEDTDLQTYFTVLQNVLSDPAYLVANTAAQNAKSDTELFVVVACLQARDVGKAVRHSPDLEVDDTKLEQYFTVLQNVLSDPAYLAANTAAQNAKQKLSQLLNDTLVIGKDDVLKVLDDAAKVAQDKIRNEKEYTKEAEKQKLELIKTTNNSINEIENREQFSMSELDNALRSAVDEIEKQTIESVGLLQAKADETFKLIAKERETIVKEAKEKTDRIKLVINEAVHTLVSETDIAVRQVKEDVQTEVKKLETKAEETLQQIGEKGKTNVDEKYEKLKEHVRKMEETLTDIKKQLFDMKREKESRGEYTIVEMFGRVRVSADDQNIVNTVENILLSASTENVRKAELSDTIKLVKEKVDTFVEDVEGIGVKVEGVCEGSIAFTFSCSRLDSLIDSIDYFQSPLIEGRLDDIARALESMTGHRVRLTVDIPADPLQDILKQLRCTHNIKAEPSDREDRKMLKEMFRPQRDKPERKCTHDGRLMIYEEEVFEAIKRYCKTDKPIVGGFGSVYLSEKKIPGLDIKVALKELTCSGDHRHIEDSAINEKLASRTMHFAIVPLLLMGSDKVRKTVWFLSPCLDKGDLYTLIKNDTQRIDGKLNTDIELKRQRRMKIVYHIIAAIDFLHTEIEKFRGAVIHLDVKTENVVLDRYYNARLTDFGVAREICLGETSIGTSPTAIPLTKGYFRPPTFEKLKKYFDYYNIGVVIRELLTGMPPCYSSGSKVEYLKDLNQDDVEFYIQEKIWEIENKRKLCDEAKQLLEISQKCIYSATGSEMNSAKKMNSKYILQEMQKIVRGYTWDNANTIGEISEPEVSPDNSVDENCDLCMVNPAVEIGLLSHARYCRCPLKVCVSCMRNSYLNPLHCHSCFKEIEPIIGGSEWGAVLIAGRYDDESAFSKSCKNDVKEIKRLVVSKCPLVFGIRKMFVRTICSSKSSQEREDVAYHIQTAFDDLKEKGVRSLFIYYSGHYIKDHGFVLERRCENADMPSKDKQNISEHLLEPRQMEDMLKSFGGNSDNTVVEKDKTVILILDCCKPPKIEPCEDPCLKIVQLNACRPNENASQEPDGAGSLFKTIFIQGLTMKANGGKCFLQRDSEPCRYCPIKGDAFITIGQLASYISSHEKAYYKLQGQKPFWHVCNATEEARIGYLVDTSADLEFTFIFHGKQEYCKIPCSFFNEINQLKGRVFTEFMDKMKVDKEKGKKLELNADEYRDVLRIVTRAGPKDKHKKELTSLEQVLSAWNGKRELVAEMRELSLIKDDMVGVFNESEEIFSFLVNEKCTRKEQEDRTVYKIDVSDYLNLGFKNQLSIGVRALEREERESSELHIISPSMTDETGIRHRRDDFVCLKIEKKATMQELT